MPTATIITHNPESTESLEAYLRDEGYDVAYARPGETQSGSSDLAIAIEACTSPAQALTRAHELASQLGCDVFVGEGIVEALDLETLEMPEAEAETRAALAPEAAGVISAEIGASEAVEPAAVDAELQGRVSDFAACGANATPPSAQEGERLSGHEEETPEYQQEPSLATSYSVVTDSQVPSSGAASLEVLSSPAVSQSDASDLLEARQQENPAPGEQRSQLGQRAWRGAKDLVGLQIAALLDRARSSSQLLKIRAAAKLEQFLLWQQVRTAALAKQREEKRRLAEKMRQQAVQQAASQHAAAGQRFAQRWQRSGDTRDWKMALTGAGVAALLVFFVLGVFTGRNHPATSQISAARKSLQLSTTTRPGANSGTPLAPAAAHGAVVNLQANDVAHMPAPQPAASVKAANLVSAGPAQMSPVHQAVVRRAPVHRVAMKAADSEPEVIVRHFNRTKTRPQARMVARVKHYSDLN